jgi:hypothetical protein
MFFPPFSLQRDKMISGLPLFPADRLGPYSAPVSFPLGFDFKKMFSAYQKAVYQAGAMKLPRLI